MITQKKRLGFIFLAVVGILLIPFIAMQVSNEVDWKVFDFLVMGILLFGTGLACDFAMSKVKNTTTRIIVFGAVLLAFFLIWAELAVGIFGTPFAGS